MKKFTKFMAAFLVVILMGGASGSIVMAEIDLGIDKVITGDGELFEEIQDEVSDIGSSSYSLLLTIAGVLFLLIIVVIGIKRAFFKNSAQKNQENNEQIMNVVIGILIVACAGTAITALVRIGSNLNF